MASNPLRVAVLGDSLSDRYRYLTDDQALHSRLEATLNGRGYRTDFLDYAVPSSTTADGLARVGQVISARPDAVIVELGTVDSLGFGSPPQTLAETRADLDQILARLTRAGIDDILLVGSKAGGGPGGWPEPVNDPFQPNQTQKNAYYTLSREYGIDYTYTQAQAAQFKAIYADLAAKYDVDYYADIWGDGLYQPGLTFDGLHPTVAGVGRLTANLLPDVEQLVRDAGGTPGAPVSGVVRGTPGADALFAPVDGGRVVAGAGNDRVVGRGGDDVLLGQAGNDSMGGGGGGDRLFGDLGRDTLSGGQGDDQIFAAAGNDILNGSPGDDLLAGGGGNDRYLTGRGGGFDTVADGGGFDRLQFVDLVSSDVTLARDGNDLLARLDDGGGAVIRNHFAGGAIEQIAFGAGAGLDVLDAGEINRLVQRGNDS